ncbi:hypothetical protein [Hyphobacterium marinum]|uniref:Uncharacterized protein n=1 Tax=Hyphobacterium marinum TaxID=3116574 RepID=A0ABU7LZZ3_9PROT|nr:hypothetical protein [Hyphobacterium sp. Y6023]MEE2567134.1 hypothetical protein [Hyphobacterium sp. Y6023]
MRALLAGTAYFAMVFAAGFVLGAIRTLILAPRVGDLAAVLIELPAILAIAWWVCGQIIRQFRLPGELTSRLVMGASAFVLLILAEYSLVWLISGLEASEFLASWGMSLAGAVGLAGQVLFAVFPLLQERRTSI